MQIIEPFEFGKYYHIYNRGINSENIFKENRNYEYFLTLYTKHIDPIADTLAWCLLKNNFHLLVRIKTFDEIIQNRKENEFNKTITAHQSFGNLFNAYTKAINKACLNLETVIKIFMVNRCTDRQLNSINKDQT